MLEVVEVGPALEVVEVGLALEVVEVGLALEEAGLALQPYSVVSFVSLLDVQNLGCARRHLYNQPRGRSLGDQDSIST